jgi:hypothetical protein
VGSHRYRQHTVAHHGAGRGLRWQHVALGVATAATVSGAGGVGYALTANTSPATPVSATPTVAASPAAAAPAPSVTRVPASGPALLDQDGRALDPALAQRVSAVYSALAADDLESIRQAYSHTGSDDWITSSSHVRSGAVRAELLAALRSAPTHTVTGSYRYSAAGYALTFGTSDSAAAPGLVQISGPWSNTASSTSTTTSGSPKPSTKTKSTSSSKGSSSAICDLSGPPVFGDPAHPNGITNRDCGYTDTRDRSRSHDPWIDDQLTARGG